MAYDVATQSLGVCLKVMKLSFDPYVVQMFREESATGWTAEDDDRFWRRMQQNEGLRALKRDASNLEKLCRHLSEHPYDREFMRCRLRYMGVFLRLHLLECMARIIYHKLPHFSARFAA
jgi:hypothetical protein